MPTIALKMPKSEHIQKKVIGSLKGIGFAEKPQSDTETLAFEFASRIKTDGHMPEQYLLYFLLVDFLGYCDLGKGEKTAWSIPIRFKNRLYVIKYRKFGIGIFEPNYEYETNANKKSSEQAELDACKITTAINTAVRMAKPYFQWRAEQAAESPNLNVINRSEYLHDRFIYFREKFYSLIKESEERKDEWATERTEYPDGTYSISCTSPTYQLNTEAQWNAQAAIDAFFSWTEHLFIHLAILQGKLNNGKDVREMAKEEWKKKFQIAFDISKPDIKSHYDKLTTLRNQVRNFMAHGSFGKQGEAFSFHTKVGAIPILLIQTPRHPYALGAKSDFNESEAISDIEKFISHLWSDSLIPAKIYIEAGLPSILTYAENGTYEKLMQSKADMEMFVRYLSQISDDASNMDW